MMSSHAKGYFVLVLHAHLPYVRHPEFEEFMEERWLFEAITETYIPLLMAFDRLRRDGIAFKLTMSLTPPLLEMFASSDLQQKYERHMEKLIELADKEEERTRNEDPQLQKLARYYSRHFREVLETYREYDRNPAKGFLEFEKSGHLEIITCNATHAFLPLLSRHMPVVKSQIEVGVQAHEKHLGRCPKGIWLAECGYYPGLDKFLSLYGLKYFFVDSHGLWYADHQPRYGVYRPAVTPEGVFVFARDPESSEEVWSAQVGYPGDSRYREFYRDVGFDRELEYIRPYIDKSGERVNTGIKYYRITSKDADLSKKEYYVLEDALKAVKEHASDFARKKERQVERLYELFDENAPVIVAPFDAELFGHWWYEGPLFLEEFFRELSKSQSVIPSTPSEVLDIFDEYQVLTPAASTWGANGYFEVWLNGSNDWIYRHYDEMIERMSEVIDRVSSPSPLEERCLNQMLRELFLALSSDWAFIMTTGTTVDYAKNRVITHTLRFHKLYEQLKSGRIDENYLKELEWQDAIFPWIDFRSFKA
ncbi:MAG: 1,4-alpha-glucan branching enzyme [Thermotogota bacterium]|nr:1,4-alpha-glucan branching enzyme [Thermotogota bacterium]MDK2864666.1 1,4-alpha-glucan branching enzyme [Thermotogota bacterium]